MSIQVSKHVLFGRQAVTIEGAQIVAFDRPASNGVVHEVFNVMMPPSGDIVDYVSNNAALSTLLSLVGQAGLATALKGTFAQWQTTIIIESFKMNDRHAVLRD